MDEPAASTRAAPVSVRNASGVPARYPAFDVTPARLISTIITEHGLARGDFGTRLRELVAKVR